MTTCAPVTTSAPMTTCAAATTTCRPVTTTAPADPVLKPHSGIAKAASKGPRTSADPTLNPLSHPEQPVSYTPTQPAWVVVNVEESAQVTVNGKRTTSTGIRRVYQGYLKPGLSYPFKIEVKEGALVVRKEFMIKAGETKTLLLVGNQLAIR